MPEVPKIPRGPLWICLLGPTLMAAVTTASFLLSFRNLRNQVSGQVSGSSALEWLPSILNLLTLAVFIVCLIRFILILNRRYSTSTVVLLTFGYVIGHGVVGFAILFGACFLMMSP